MAKSTEQTLRELFRLSGVEVKHITPEAKDALYQWGKVRWNEGYEVARDTFAVSTFEPDYFGHGQQG